MDPNHSIMDFSIEEEYFEVKDDTAVLPDDIMVIIFKELSLEDIKVVKQVSKRFYGIVHENYHKLERRKVHELSIEYDETDSYPFHINVTFRLIINLNSGGALISDYKRQGSFENSRELSSFLNTVDLRNIGNLDLPFADNIDIFGILNGSFQEGTNIGHMSILKLAEKDFTSFLNFIGKLSSIKGFNIAHLCSSSTEAKDFLSLLSLPSFGSIEFLGVVECPETKILSADFVTKLLEKNSSMKSLNFGSMNIELLESIFKEHFKVEQPCNMENECDYNQITVNLFYGGDIEYLCDIFRNCLNELENVEEAINSQNLRNYVEFGSNVDCKNCLEKAHKIMRIIRLWNHLYYFDESDH
uniref:F-box domain-containing protein n=1 Tax=Strongyloides papillosus TaxID=174720 RepID=A0A0N5B5D5_STREA